MSTERLVDSLHPLRLPSRTAELRQLRADRVLMRMGATHFLGLLRDNADRDETWLDALSPDPSDVYSEPEEAQTDAEAPQTQVEAPPVVGGVENYSIVEHVEASPVFEGVESYPVVEHVEDQPFVEHAEHSPGAGA